MRFFITTALAVAGAFAQNAAPPPAPPSPGALTPPLPSNSAPAVANTPSTTLTPASALPRVPGPPLPPSKAPGPKGVTNPKSSRPPPKTGGETLPDLSGTAKMFPPGPDVRSPVLLPREPPGKYKVEITTHSLFPNRTLYIPQGVSPGVKVPIFAWENGICYLYGRMYQQFLQDVASHGYLVITPGQPSSLSKTSSNAQWQLDSITQARAWAGIQGPENGLLTPFTIDTSKAAIGGHSCGGSETVRNLAVADDEGITTGIVMNSAGSSAAFVDVNVPMLWIHGGQTDVEDAQDRNFDFVASERPDLPVVELGLQTGHLGSFWSPRGGIYAESVRRWLDFQLKGNQEEKAWFLGGNSSAAFKRGWSSVQTNALE